MISGFRLKTKLRIFALACIVVGIAGAFLVAYRYEEKLYSRALELRGRVMAESLRASALEPLLNYDIIRLDDIIDALRSGHHDWHEDLAYAIVHDAEGRIVAHSHGYESYGTIPADQATRSALAFSGVENVQIIGGDVLEIDRPVEVADKRWGTVRIGLNLAPVRAEIANARVRTLSIVVVMALILAAIAGAIIRPLFLGPLDVVVNAIKAVGRRNYEHRIAHARRDEIGELYDAINDMAQTLEKREREHVLFGAYVSSRVRDAILSGDTSTDGTRVKAAILFADLRGFTRRGEGLPAHDVLALLNLFCSRMAAAVEAHGGIVDKFIGDCVMAVFGVPTASDDAALRAARCASSMKAELAELNMGLAARGLEPLSMGVGVHFGECVAGTVGTPTRMQYTVVGDAVNVAARLEQMTKELGESVLFTQDVVDGCAGEVAVRPLGEFPVRGRNGTLRLYTFAEEAAAGVDQEDTTLVARIRRRVAGSRG